MSNRNYKPIKYFKSLGFSVTYMRKLLEDKLIPFSKSSEGKKATIFICTYDFEKYLDSLREETESDCASQKNVQ